MKGVRESQVSFMGNKGHLFPRKRQDMVRNLKTTGLTCTLAVLVALAVSFSFWPRLFSITRSQYFDMRNSLPLGVPLKPTDAPVPQEIMALIKKIKRARMAAEAAGVNATAFSKRDRLAWHKANPCMSRRELWPAYKERRHSQVLEVHPYLEKVLREYSKLHRACMRNVGDDVIGFFKRKDPSSGCKFILGDNEEGTGIGNKVLSAASAVMYAVLTQRVLLVPTSTSIPDIMCEPFEGSSWKVSTDGALTPAKKHEELWHHVAEVNKAVDGLHRGWRNMTANLYAARVNEDWDCQPEKRFFCDAEQEFYDTHVTWMYFSECLYYLPKLFAVPRFRPTLEALFPDRMALTHLLRTTMLPTDPVWLRVQQVNHVHFKNVDHVVGIQTRYFHGKSDYALLHEATEKAVAQCLLENRLLPNTSLANTLNGEEATGGAPPVGPGGGTPAETYLIFITSLYDALKDHLTKIYVRSPARTGAAVGIVQLTHEDEQQFGVEVDRQALAEVLGLSLADDVIATPQSTFGAIASAYGGLVPWFIDIRPKARTGCVRGVSVDACYQLPSSKHFVCPHAPGLNGTRIADVVPYIQDCHPIETPFVEVYGAGLGFQLMTVLNRTGLTPGSIE